MAYSNSRLPTRRFFPPGYVSGRIFGPERLISVTPDTAVASGVKAEGGTPLWGLSRRLSHLETGEQRKAGGQGVEDVAINQDLEKIGLRPQSVRGPPQFQITSRSPGWDG